MTRARGGGRLPGVSVGALTIVALLATSAQASDAPGDAVSLAASPGTVTFGQKTTLSGAVSPASAGEMVSIVDLIADGAPVASATTGADGSYIVQLKPERTLELRAEWGTALSEPVTVKVRPVIEASLGPVSLFGKARVAGALQPAGAASHVTVSLLRRGSVVATREAPVGGSGTFRAALPVAKPGAYRARVQVPPGSLLAAQSQTGRRRTPLPALRQGSKGREVKHLERRLRSLGYHILGVNRRFDYRTGDAVLAFHKVQGMPRTKDVTRRTWAKLASPRRPQPQSTRPKFHIEIDQTKQVLYVVKDGAIWRIVHTSTGRNGWTRDGVWRVHRKIAGYSPNRLWYPSYFDGLRAVHGWPEVPTYPASHGCARVPNWTAVWLHGLMDYGTVVRVYH